MRTNPQFEGQNSKDPSLDFFRHAKYPASGTIKKPCEDSSKELHALIKFLHTGKKVTINAAIERMVSVEDRRLGDLDSV